MSDMLGGGITSSHVGRPLAEAETSAMSRLQVKAPAGLKDWERELISISCRLFVRFNIFYCQKSNMPARAPEKKAYNAQHALTHKIKKGLLDATRSTLAGRKNQSKTLKK
jgi:hypothetical protein